MSKIKYVIIEKNGIEQPLIFGECLNHADAVFGKDGIISAGFVQIYSEDNQVKVCCFGESVSLKLKSRKEVDDAIIISHLFNPYN